MSTVYKNTIYGPVSQKTAAGTTAVDNQTQGSLQDLVKLPSGDSPSLGNDGYMHYTEQWKGPYVPLRDVVCLLKINMTIQDVHNKLNTAIPGQLIKRFDVPAIPTGYYWLLEGFKVRELDKAGDHAIAEINFVCDKIESETGSDIKYQRKQIAWNLRWQSYTFSPYGFCKNDMKEDKLATEPPEEQSRDFASRYNIEQYLQKSKGRSNYPNFIYQANDGKMRRLNYAEYAIMKKVAKGENALWHYPIIEKITVDNWSANSIVDLQNIQPKDGEVNYIDYINTPDNCPYDFGQRWQWVKIDDSYTQAWQDSGSKNSLTYTHKEAWMGCISADINFYGATPFSHDDIDNTHWLPGAL